ncbi:hypothetical protein AAG565_12135 [Fontimonas sp. SYSU GA230001]|uniref:hypothetical protein n=1 Tax=Fontimonas sp. SYSU GA230001 TaxID=3142450 RepID=UPI0032B518FB
MPSSAAADPVEALQDLHEGPNRLAGVVALVRRRCAEAPDVLRETRARRSLSNVLARPAAPAGSGTHMTQLVLGILRAQRRFAGRGAASLPFSR